MPIYEYECRRCGHRFELLQSFSDKPRKRCPECRGGVERLISTPAIRFKGSGWYVTDYADKNKKKADADSAADGGSGADKPDKGSDAKTETKGGETADKKSDKVEKKAS